MFLIFTALLFSLLISLSLLSFNFQSFLEKIIAYVVLFWIGTIQRTLLLKNLAAHRLKNRRTALFYSISVSIIIYLWVSLGIQTKVYLEQLKYNKGTYFAFENYSGFKKTK